MKAKEVRLAAAVDSHRDEGDPASYTDRRAADGSRHMSAVAFAVRRAAAIPDEIDARGETVAELLVRIDSGVDDVHDDTAT